MPTWLFAVNTTILETESNYACDVQYPWESFAVVSHSHTMAVPPVYMDVVPVSNTQYAGFLRDSAYEPAHQQNFLRDWNNGTFPAGWDSKPVTWVDMMDSSAYCSFYGKRLPNDWERQRAAQGEDGRAYPWGNAWDSSRVPVQQIDRTRGPSVDVGTHPSGASPFGLQDMMGLVWQWTNEFTDEHTRAGVVRGGSYYLPQGSHWYFPNDLGPDGTVRVSSHNKLLFMAPAYDRHGTVGFRCVQDAVQSEGRYASSSA